MIKDNVNFNDIDDGKINFEEAGLNTDQKVVELYDDDERLLECITPEDVVTLLKIIIDEDLDVNANKFGQDADKYWKVVALRIAARSFIDVCENEGVF